MSSRAPANLCDWIIRQADLHVTSEPLASVNVCLYRAAQKVWQLRHMTFGLGGVT